MANPFRCCKKGTPRCAEILDALMKNSFSRVIVLDKKNTVLWMNRYIEDRDVHEAIGKKIWEIAPTPETSLKLMDEARKTMKPLIHENIPGMDGTRRRLKVIPLSDGWILAITSPSQEKPLSKREMEIKNLCDGGMRIKDISNHLKISPNTVASHKKSYRKKLLPLLAVFLDQISNFLF